MTGFGCTDSRRTVTNSSATSSRRLTPPAVSCPQDGIRNDPAEKECVGILCDRVVDEVELPGLAIDPPVREAKSDLHRIESALLEYSSRNSMARRVGTGKTTYIGSWLTTVVKVPDVGPTMLPTVTDVRPMRPSIGERISV